MQLKAYKTGESIPGGYPVSSRQLIEAGDVVARRQRHFSPFLQHTQPDPIPSQRAFIAKNFTKHFWPSYELGFVRYFEEWRKKPFKAVSAIAMGTGIGLLLTAFRNHSHVVKGVFLLALMGIPVFSAVKYLPEMKAAYKTVQEGEPTKGLEQFKKAMDELVYQVGHVYLKPLTLGLIIIAPLLALPRMAKQPINFFEKGMQRLLTSMGPNNTRVTHSFLEPILSRIDTFANWLIRLTKPVENTRLMKGLAEAAGVNKH